MKRSVLESIEGVEIYPIISLLIFVALFAGVIYYVLKMSKTEVDRLSSIPLEETEKENNYKNNHA